MRPMVRLVAALFDVYSLLIVARVVISWLDLGYRHPAVRFVVDMTEPLLRPIRRKLPLWGGLDLSPAVALLLVWLARDVVVRLLATLWMG